IGDLIDKLRADIPSPRKTTTTNFPGGKGHKAKRPGEPVDTSSAELAVERANAETTFALFKDSLDRETKELQRQLDERKLSISDFYQEKYRLDKEEIDSELAELGKLRLAEQEKLNNELKRIAEEKSSGRITAEQAEAKTN